MIKVRFHLGRGENYKHWQIVEFPNVKYFDPNENNLILTNCLLKNNKNVAEKIYKGENKTVCAWILCEKVDIVLNSNFNKKKYKKISYNPKKFPYWINLSENELLQTFDDNRSIDNYKFSEIRSIGKTLYAIE
jgi:hypothetical protein